MTLTEKKRKLSEILGINLFEPRFKEIDVVLGEEDTEAEKAAAAEYEPESETKSADDEASEVISTDDAEEKADKPEGEEEKPEDGEQDTETDDSDEEAAEKESEAEQGAEESDKPAEDEAETAERTEAEGSEAKANEQSGEDELFDAKLEAKLLRAGIREDRLDAAKKLFKADHTLAEIEKVEKWVKEYPEWTQQKVKEPAKGFGMGVGENDNSETAEEKRLRELGII